MELERLRLQVKEDNIKKIKNTTVLVVGLGGVGSYATESLTRAGIGKLIIIDNDKIDITNLNRQLMTLHSNIGEYKTDVWDSRIKDINPNCEVIKITDFLTTDNIDIISKYKIDYIVDACDTIMTKKELIRYAVSNNIKIISSMGTGNKLEPSKLKIIDIRKTSYDPIAKILRKYVVDNKINSKVTVVSSTEQPKKVEGTISSISYVPSVAGILLTSYVINDIINV